MRNYYTLKFLCLLVFIIYSAQEMNAQIIYTNIADTTLHRSTNQGGTISYSFDINNDATMDYNFGVRAQLIPDTSCSLIPAAQTNLSAWFNTLPGYSNQVGDSAGSVAFVPFNTVIDLAAYSWSITQSNYLTKHDFFVSQCTWDSTSTGNWTSGITGYIALKFKIGAFVHYGWVRVHLEINVDSTNNSEISLTIYDFAYDATANQPILAGDSGSSVGITESKSSNKLFNIYPLPARNFINVETNFVQNSEIILYNSKGKKVIHQILNSTSSKVDLEKTTPGIYFYMIKTSGTIIQQGKIIVE